MLRTVSHYIGQSRVKNIDKTSLYDRDKCECKETKSPFNGRNSIKGKRQKTLTSLQDKGIVLKDKVRTFELS